MEKKQVRQERRRSVLVFLLVGMVLANILLIYLILQNKNAAINDLNKIMAENKADYEKELAKLEEKLQDQIAETERIEGDNKLFIDSLQRDLEEIKASRDALRNTTTITQNQLREYKEKIEAYEMLLVKKDKMIVELREQMTTLYDQNNQLKTEKVELQYEVGQTKKDKELLVGRINQAAVLRAENLIVNAIENNGKLKSGGQYRASNIDKLDISFNLAENKFAKIGGKDVFLRVLDPASGVLYNQDGTSGNFTLSDGKSAAYSVKQQILFDNSRQNVRFQFSRTGDYAPGRYAVEVFCDGERIGVGSFEVR
ncbi:MAG: hypothetical protein NW226_06560 [Microscillaceae bacterium]|nr:hypothetical protein [Microscillaceae bacterium]